MSHLLAGHPHDRRRTTCRTFPPSYLFEIFFVALDSLPCSSEKALPREMLPQRRFSHTHFHPLIPAYYSFGTPGFPGGRRAALLLLAGANRQDLMLLEPLSSRHRKLVAQNHRRRVGM